MVPVLYVVITRLTYGKEKLQWLQSHHEERMEKSKKVEAQNIDPELEYELERSRNENKQEGDQNKHQEG